MNLNLLGHFRLPVSRTVAPLSLCHQPVYGTQSGMRLRLPNGNTVKNGAVSITYDDASRNQFTRALPVMERALKTILLHHFLWLVITGPDHRGSQYHGKFVGRPVEVIIKRICHYPHE